MASPLASTVLIASALLGCAVLYIVPWRQFKIWPQAPSRTLRPHRFELLTASIPTGFDWHAYKLYNPDLNYLPSEDDAKAHYLRAGYFEGRIYRRLPTTFRYRALGGLCNQLYAHLSVLTLAALMRSEVIVPPALSRESFQQNGGWLEAPPDSLLDLTSMEEYWGAQGVHINKGPWRPGRVDLWKRKSGVAVRTRCLVVPTPYLQLRTVENYTLELVSRVQAAVQPLLIGNPRRLDDLCVHFNLETAYLGIHGARSKPAITEAAKGIIFPPEVVSAAAMIVKKLGPFVGVHLRLEGDWPWPRAEEHWGKLLDRYSTVMLEAGFNRSSQVYAASGIFSYHKPEENEGLSDALQSRGVLGSLLYKELLLPAPLLEGFNSEQRALIDLLVLSEAEMAVGYCLSSYSKFLRELRALRGQPKHTTFFVQIPKCDSPGIHNFQEEAWGFAP